MMVRAYRYGLPRQIDGRDDVEQQIGRAHRYAHRLTEIERSRRTRREAVAADATDRLATLSAIDADAQGEIRAARKTCEVYWGTYLLVEASAQQARRAKEPPRFTPWQWGGGRIGVQLQGGLSVADALAGTDTRLRIGALASDERPRSRRHDPARGVGRTTMALRVGTTEDREPVWATWQLVLHRPLPTAGRIKTATVVRRREPGRHGADRYRDELVLVIEQPESAPTAVAAESAVALDLGWRRLDDGSIRLATWRDTTGAVGEYRLRPSVTEAALVHADGLQSLRDRLRDQMRSMLVATQPRWPEAWPDGMRRRLQTVGQWRSATRFRMLWDYWRGHRFSGDDEAFAVLDRWWRGDGAEDHGERHRWEYESHERHTALRRRTDQYLAWAADLVRRYETIVLERFDLRAVAQATADETPQAHHARRQRARASVGAFRATILWAARREGRQVACVPSVDTTRTCGTCWHVDTEGDFARTILHTCPACGRTADQDRVAADHLLRIWRERPGDARIVVAARSADGSGGSGHTRGGAWARRKAAKRDRSQVDRKETAAQGDAW